MEKSYVSLGVNICKICGTEFDSGEILMDKRLRKSMGRKTITGYGMCPEHQKLKDDGFLALIEVSNKGNETILSNENAIRTGNVAHIPKYIAKEIFNIEANMDAFDMMFIEVGVIEKLQSMVEPEDTNEMPTL
jgi:hypothetical protein